MKKYIFLFLIVSFISCGNKKEIELPEVSTATKTDMLDYSAAYLFFNPNEKDSVELNRKNLISTTNWVLHVDKRLALKQAIPTIKMLQEKKKNNEMHKNEDAKNYFSVNNKEIENLSFIDFTETEYLVDDQFSKFYIEEHHNDYTNKFPITINFNKENKITLNGTSAERGELVAFIKEFADFSAPNKETILYLNFDEHLTFQQYITNLQLAKKAAGDLITIAPIQFVYNEGKLPDCGCTL
ncbi:hypothetical protein SAMN05216480_101895 [Pustulibacterium marinum]|uniref:Uncharacterized protein n=1 Tax=Pustulibacterium marinum TaxID=1224947 RepID=A0A1I7FDW5_9FLAO|nr:hypothetical protein [Pustulibacterium marinum]SFU34369.1 hypothetical protein SAMN05216480_101895 [Pustulibacterium marinum]